MSKEQFLQKCRFCHENLRGNGRRPRTGMKQFPELERAYRGLKDDPECQTAFLRLEHAYNIVFRMLYA